MIRSEKDFLENLRGAIYMGRLSSMDRDLLLDKIDGMVKNRLLIFSDKTEPYVEVDIRVIAPNPNFKPVEIKGKPLSETIIEERR